MRRWLLAVLLGTWPFTWAMAYAGELRNVTLHVNGQCFEPKVVYDDTYETSGIVEGRVGGEGTNVVSVYHEPLYRKVGRPQVTWVPCQEGK